MDRRTHARSKDGLPTNCLNTEQPAVDQQQHMDTNNNTAERNTKTHDLFFEGLKGSST